MQIDSRNVKAHFLKLAAWKLAILMLLLAVRKMAAVGAEARESRLEYCGGWSSCSVRVRRSWTAVQGPTC